MLRITIISSAMATLLASPLMHAQFSNEAHPRLWLRTSDEAAIQHKIETDPLAAQLQEKLITRANGLLQTRTCRYDIPDGRRLLGESRRAIHQVMISSWAWRTTGDHKYLNRAIAELEAACALKDWNPSHFLDTAEMATAVAIGYDWLYNELTPAQRSMCESAIRDKALRPAKHLYDHKVWWNRAINNWGQVCGSGITLAAIAIQGKDNGLSAGLIERGIDLVTRCQHFYEPDGLYPEGPGYWHYGTNYHVLLLSACETLKHPIEIPKLLEKSGNSIIQLHSPTLLPFNFADGKAKAQSKTPAQTWIAMHFNNHAQIQDLRQMLNTAIERNWDIAGHRMAPLQLVWLPAPSNSSKPLPLHDVFHGEQSVAVFRTGWQPNDAWLAIKGGTPIGGHSQMDVGSFCYDSMGQRWIHDLGSDNYNMPGYFGPQRFDYFRNQNRSHNTLEINHQLQDPEAQPSPITASSHGNSPASVTMDLTPAYHESATSVHRTVSFDTSTGEAIIHDEISQPTGDVVWRVVTDAAATISGDSVTLTKQGQSITLENLSSHGTWSIEDASPPQDIEDPNDGFRRVTFTAQKKDRISIKIGIRP